jgi:hypothetical protein
VENTRALSTRRDIFLDERGTGLRVTWHPERDLVVLSVWQGDSCVGTFRMLVQDVPRLSSLLAAALGDWVDQAGPGPEGPGAQERGAGAGGWEHGAGTGGREAGGGGSGSGAVRSGVGLSMQRRLRLSRPVLRLRGLRHRRRGSG